MKLKKCPPGKEVFEDEYGWYYIEREFDLFTGPRGEVIDVRYYIKLKPRRRRRSSPITSIDHNLF